MIKRILIRFGDNDFGWLMFEFAQIVIRFKNWNRRYYKEPLIKEDIVKLFNQTSWALYDFMTGENFHEHKDYLQIKEKDVFFNEEVEEKMFSYNSWGNGDSVYIDFENEQINVL